MFVYVGKCVYMCHACIYVYMYLCICVCNLKNHELLFLHSFTLTAWFKYDRNYVGILSLLKKYLSLLKSMADVGSEEQYKT